MNEEVQSLIKNYGMKPHPEGGFYIESFKSTINVTTATGKLRSAGTSIYFLTFGDQVSRMHRLQSDEIWHFYKGSPISIVELLPENGGFRETLLGPDLLQYTVIANTWFGSYPVGSNASSESEAPPYSFVGCTVSPGFEFEDFELASRSKLTVEFPNAAKIIEKLTVGLS